MKVFDVAKTTEPVEFQIGADLFTAYPPEALPAYVLIEYSELVTQGKIHDAHKAFFAKSLIGESATLFEHRLHAHDNPITLATMIQVAEWLVEQYSAIPTKRAKR